MGAVAVVGGRGVGRASPPPPRARAAAMAARMASAGSAEAAASAASALRFFLLARPLVGAAEGGACEGAPPRARSAFLSLRAWLMMRGREGKAGATEREWRDRQRVFARAPRGRTSESRHVSGIAHPGLQSMPTVSSRSSSLRSRERSSTVSTPCAAKRG